MCPIFLAWSAYVIIKAGRVRNEDIQYNTHGLYLLGLYLPYEQPCPSIGLLVCHILPNGWDVTLPCSYRCTCLKFKLASFYVWEMILNLFHACLDPNHFIRFTATHKRRERERERERESGRERERERESF